MPSVNLWTSHSNIIQLDFSIGSVLSFEQYLQVKRA